MYGNLLQDGFRRRVLEESCLCGGATVSVRAEMSSPVQLSTRGMFDERRIRSEGMSDDLKRDGLTVMGHYSDDRVDDTVLRNLDRLERR
jgi:hypothetical protein